MGAPPNSQAAPLPTNLPFRLVSKTIGAGAYASIRKAVPLNKSSPIIAIKFINKDHAVRVGRLSPKQVKYEISIHAEVCKDRAHPNIIRLLNYGEDPVWYWLALELAEGGDLFDKIEADEGVPEEVAHFYFKQLMSAVAWCHSRGVAHRDIKPENMLLSADGNLKLADFGLATTYMDVRSGRTKTCATVCGSPPYIAPEIVLTGTANMRRKRNNETSERAGYKPDLTDLWSCAIVLFVLLVGNTPWDSPVPESSPEYAEFLATNGRPNDELWDNIPLDALSLIRGMLRVNPAERFKLDQINTHPWFLKPNQYMSSKGTTLDSVALATTMMSRLRIDMSSNYDSQNRSKTITQADYDSQSQPWAQAFPNTQPETPATDTAFDWEAPAPTTSLIAASQPTTASDRSAAAAFTDSARHLLDTDVSLSQFSASQALPLTLTQAARRFGDIAPAHALTRFYSAVPVGQLLATLRAGLLALGVATTDRGAEGVVGRHVLFVKAMDARRQPMGGNVVVESLGQGSGLVEVRMVRSKADPLEWRRLFKRLVVQVRDVVFVPNEGGGGGWSQV
ncbi:Pkinase-domain-containing protein [Myriangium duriaei CBS 260.36]|uniref:non-specific serine/threonine protein kinase n=1 Tax=Myriangium duriaei CBS 260.36 TaxID=1168546 RepID=A0A9P4J1A9_9PEZI|nr:Pkinase-domain-containing protein [Myriangium duriaei CBS 260.36]